MEGIGIPTLPCLTILERRPYIFVHLAQGTHMRANLNLDQFQSLPVELRLGQGRIYLENERMVLLHIQALDALRGELIQTLGTHRARGLLMRMGFEGGKHDAEMARRLVPEASDKDLLLIGPALHALEGVAHIKPTSLNVDIARGLFEMEADWDYSYEAELQLRNRGKSDEVPVCWMKLGYASGFASTLVRRTILFREVECMGCGHRRCHVIGKTVEMWGGNAAEELKLMQPDRVADQLVALQEQVSMLRHSLGSEIDAGFMIGASPSFLRAYELVEKVAQTQSTVLLLGETGVGKEMFARSLHALSSRRSNPFVAVNCGALPENLIEAELFGVEKGAYTGADRSRPGRFELAKGGTLFLDEIGDLSASAQVKLLRVLQNGEFERIGDTRTRRAEVRIVAATNRDLAERMKEGGFRADLFFRINSFPITLPPLRARREDILPLAAHFIRKICAREGKTISGMTDQAEEALLAYNWPGNIRELENVVERSVILTESGSMIDLPILNNGPSFVPAPLSAALAEAAAINESDIANKVIGGVFSIRDIEAKVIELAVERSNGNLAEAARLVGISRRQLTYRRANARRTKRVT
jgi:two-component system, NtrC family, response regulator HydG